MSQPNVASRQSNSCGKFCRPAYNQQLWRMHGSVLEHARRVGLWAMGDKHGPIPAGGVCLQLLDSAQGKPIQTWRFTDRA